MLPYNIDEPGHMEVDLVHHCGLSASGEYVHTLQMVDIATGCCSWKELPCDARYIREIHLSSTEPKNFLQPPLLQERNGFLVRSLLGYERLDTVAQTILLNRIYQKVWVYFNFFQPVRKLVAKEMISA